MNETKDQAPQFSDTEPDFQAQMEFWQNMQTAGALWLEAVNKMQAHRNSDEDIPIDPLGVNESLANTWLNFWREPEKALQKQASLWQGMIDIWNAQLSGESSENLNLPKDRRFGHKAWQSNMVAAALKSSYLFFHQWMDDVLHDLDTLDEHERFVAGLSTRNLVESMNPANFAWSNPEVIETTIEERAANLVRGMQMLVDDVERGNGELLVRQVDYDAFEVGENIAVTKGEVIFEHPHFQMIQYAPTTKKVNSIPILIIPPWINKYYILDLNEKKSFAKWIVERGYTVFMISWINADESTRDFTWASRLEALREAIDVVLKESHAEKTHLISFCIGGTMTGSLLAELAKRNDDVVKSSTFLTAQFDFAHSGELMAFVSDKSVEMLEQYREQGYIPAQAMSNAFNMMRSNDLIWSYIVNNYMLGRKPMAFDLLYWNSDSMRMPVDVQKFYLAQFYLRNAFMDGKLPMGDHELGVEDITTPSYHLAAIDDHIAPSASVYIAAQAMKNADVRYVLTGSGHIAGVVNPPVLEKYQHWVNDDLSASDLNEWIAGAQENKGSWWLDWIDWLKEFGVEMVDARVVGREFKPIEPAPGRYVKVRFDSASD